MFEAVFEQVGANVSAKSQFSIHGEERVKDNVVVICSVVHVPIQIESIATTSSMIAPTKPEEELNGNNEQQIPEDEENDDEEEAGVTPGTGEFVYA